MHIEMGRVKFGDCFVISNNCDKLIVDCGSKNKGSGKLAYNELLTMVNLNTCKLNLLISHFDDDHYNGILEIDESSNTGLFNNIYISAYLHNNKTAINNIGYLIALGLEKKYSSNYPKNLCELFIKIPKLINKNGKLILVKSNTEVHVGNDKFISIWPDINPNNISIDFDDTIWKNILDKLFNLEISFKELNKGNESKYNHNNFMSLNIENSVNIFSNSLENYMNYFYEGTIEKVIEAGQELKISLERILEINKDVNKFYNKIKLLVREAPTLNNNISFFHNYNNFQKKINKQYKILIKDMNSSSIIMHKDNDILFLGDAPPKIIKNLSQKGLIMKTYQAIKVQHHGTINYFYQDMPRAKFYLISNGGYKNRKISEKFIEYADFICCSNAWEDLRYCEYFSKNKRCSYKCIKNLLCLDFDCQNKIICNIDYPCIYKTCQKLCSV